jgi:hypothetical protein
MGFVRRGRAADGQTVAVSGLVLEAPAPPVGGPAIGPGSHAEMRIWCDWGEGGRALSSRMRLNEAHWLVLGMEVPVLLDPARPEKFSLDWERIPPMDVRVAAGDPALADPIAARRRVAQALGLSSSETGTWRTERVERALANAAGLAAPAGRLRAVAIIATIRGRRVIVGDADNVSSHDSVSFRRPSDAVLSVMLPGRRPYAVFVPRFSCSVDLLDPFWQPLPALVSATDPSAVAVVWEEVPREDAQLQERIAGSLAAQQERVAMVAEFGRAQLAALGQPGGGAPPAAAPPAADWSAQSAQMAPAAADWSAQSAQMARLAADNARRTLQYIQDPAMRSLLISQYRAAGIEIDE